MTLAIREASDDDLPGLLECLRAFRSGGIEPSTLAFRALVTMPGVRLLVACAGQKIVGTATLHRIRHLYGDSAQLEDVAVLPAWRGRGVGRALVAAAVDQARLMRAYKITLHCADDVAGFYESCLPGITRLGGLRLTLEG